MNITVKFNVNDRMTVRLSDKGKQIIKDLRTARRTRYPKQNWDNHYKYDEDGYLTEQAWCLMSLFGEYMGNGIGLPFETTVELHDCEVTIK